MNSWADTLPFLVMPIGSLLVGAFVYWIASRPEKPRPPAE